MSTVWLLLLGFLGLLLAVAALVGLLHLTRGTPVSRVVGDELPDCGPAISGPAFGRMLPLLAQVDLLPGNAVEVLANGNETYPRLWADLRAARRSISIQLYYCKPGRIADELSEILRERARAGVEVRFLYDAFGGFDLPGRYTAGLRAAGVQVAAFRPIRWYALHKVQHRSHVRLVVVDGRVAYTGGFGLDDKWRGDGRREGEWRDTNVRCAGPTAPQFQAAFAGGWAEATGDLLMGEHLFPLVPGTGGGTPSSGTPSGGTPSGGTPSSGTPGGAAHDATAAGLLHAVPTLGSTTAERFLAASIAGARRTLYVANSYFAPDDDFRRLLVAAARRGVDVRVLTASRRSDVKTVYYAGRRRYEELLAGGVRIYEYQPAMMHAKTLVADGTWCTVGSVSFDNRSLALNDESTLVAHDAAVGARLEALFAEDLRHAVEVTLDAYRRRPWPVRLVEVGAELLSRVL